MGSKAPRVGFCLYDFANSAFATIAVTVFGSAYFKNVLVGDQVLRIGSLELRGSSAWGAVVSGSMLCVTLSAPIMGGIADRTGKKKLFLSVYTAVCVLALIGLAFLKPGDAWQAALLYIVAYFAFEGAYVFYNAFLPDIAGPDEVGKLSGLAWGIGYAGGLLALVATFPLVPKRYDASAASAARWIYLLVAAWFAVFGGVAIALLRERVPVRIIPMTTAAREGFAEIIRTGREIGKHRAILWFLVAYFFYTDALTTFLDFAGIYTEAVLGFGPKQHQMLFLVLNICAIPGTILFGRLLDRIGGKRAIGITLVVWCGTVAAISVVQSHAVFWGLACVIAVVVGATQASSRAMMAKLSPPEKAGEYMGFLALSGKASAVLGPLLYGAIADGAGHRLAVRVLCVFFVVAFLFLQLVNERPATALEK